MPDLTIPPFRHHVSVRTPDGREVDAAVEDEHAVRAAAGLTMVAGAVAFGYAYFDRQYVPLQVVTACFAVEFLIRVTLGLRVSPAGLIAGVITAGRAPDWVSAAPKRFAWTLGLAMSLAMTAITNSGIRGPLPLTICLICLALMWLEAVLGLCLGCETHRFMVRRGWVAKDDAFEVCTHGACTIEERR